MIHAKRIIVCLKCKQEKSHAARGLCVKCYHHERDYGNLDKFFTIHKKYDYSKKARAVSERRYSIAGLSQLRHTMTKEVKKRLKETFEMLSQARPKEEYVVQI